jgi:hypothetical protein
VPTDVVTSNVEFRSLDGLAEMPCDTGARDLTPATVVLRLR